MSTLDFVLHFALYYSSILYSRRLNIFDVNDKFHLNNSEFSVY